jgi:hypothetical protein
MPQPRYRNILTLCALLTVAGSAPAQAPRADADFDRLHRELFAQKEAWQEIPWRLSLLEAQAAAVKEKKPIYILVRSGHPLGCV